MFNEIKATALAIKILEKIGEMEYLKLLKLMYLSEKKCILENHLSITDDIFVCMKFGPVLSITYSLIKEEKEISHYKNDLKLIKDSIYYNSYWSENILINEHSVSIKKESTLKTDDYLSVSENKNIESVLKDHGMKSSFELIKYLHDSKVCPEWKDPSPNSVKQLNVSDIMNLNGKTDKDYKKFVFLKMLKK